FALLGQTIRAGSADWLLGRCRFGAKKVARTQNGFVSRFRRQPYRARSSLAARSSRVLRPGLSRRFRKRPIKFWQNRFSKRPGLRRLWKGPLLPGLERRRPTQSLFAGNARRAAC